jgi:hypothetical protein
MGIYVSQLFFFKKMEFLLVLSVPHALAPTCTTFTTHDNDTVALTVAKSIQEKMGQNVVVLPAVVPRHIRDMNRPFARQSVWRKELDQLIANGPRGRTVHIDVHSYPQSYYDFKGADVVMLVADLLSIGPFCTKILCALMKKHKVGIIQ